MPENKIKIAYLLGSLNRGGTETLLLDILKNGEDQFHKITIYRKDGNFSGHFRSSGSPLYKLTPGPIYLFWLYLWKLRRILKNNSVSVVHTHQKLDTLYARMACLGLKIKIIQTIHEFDFQINIISRFLFGIGFYLADCNLFVSNFQKHHFVTSYPGVAKKPSFTMYNGIDFGRFNQITRSDLRREFQLADKTLLMGMVGNFVKGHDQLTICRFLTVLNSQGIDFKFLFVGKKDERNALLYDECVKFCEFNGLSDKCLFIGSRSDVPDILNQLDAFFYSSGHDTFGIAVIEAIVAGIPVFVNDWAVMREITDNGDRAILYKTKDENDLYNKFIQFISQPNELRRKAKLNAEWARKKYSIREHLKKLKEVYSAL